MSKKSNLPLIDMKALNFWEINKKIRPFVIDIMYESDIFLRFNLFFLKKRNNIWKIHLVHTAPYATRFFFQLSDNSLAIPPEIAASPPQ
jgi:hypothetical protein